jgi:hypothetical protein
MRKQLLNLALCAAALLGCEKNEKATTTAPEIEKRQCTPDELVRIKNITTIVKKIGEKIISIEPNSQDVPPAILQLETTNFVCTDQGPIITCDPTQPRTCTINPAKMAEKKMEKIVGEFASAQTDDLKKKPIINDRYQIITQEAIDKIKTPN